MPNVDTARWRTYQVNFFLARFWPGFLRSFCRVSAVVSPARLISAKRDRVHIGCSARRHRLRDRAVDCALDAPNLECTSPLARTAPTDASMSTCPIRPAIFSGREIFSLENVRTNLIKHLFLHNGI